jgi:hypothetical protein
LIYRFSKQLLPIDINHIFKGDLSNNLTWEFDFGEISKRRFGRSYIEQTSYDPNARSGDFYNPVGIDRGGLVLFEDHGAGIFQRLLWFHRTDYESDMDYVTFEVGHFLSSSFLFESHTISQPENACPLLVIGCRLFPNKFPQNTCRAAWVPHKVRLYIAMCWTIIWPLLCTI